MNQSFESGLFALMSTNPTVADFNGTDNNGNPEYQLFYIAVFDPPLTLPYGVFNRYKRTHEMDLEGNITQLISSYHMEIYHNVSWDLLDFQQRIRTLLESLAETVVGGEYIQQIEVEDDYHEMPPAIQEVRVRVYKGCLDFEVVHAPSQNR